MDKPKQHTRHIGNVLLTRRIQLDPTHHRTREEWAETVRCAGPIDQPHETVRALETGARDSYDPTTLATLENAYQLKPGSLGEALQGGDLVADDGQVLYPPPGR